MTGIREQLITNPVEKARGEVLKYYLYQLTMSKGFVAPVIIEFILSHGISYSKVGILTSLFMATWVIMETPAGYLGDRFNRQSMLAISSLLTVIALLMFGVSETFVSFAIAYIMWGLSIVFRSGIDTSWLYDKLAESGEEEKFSSVQGRSKAITLAMSAVAAPVGAWLATIDWSYPFFANSGILLISGVVAMSLPETSITEKEDETFTISKAIRGVREFFSRPFLRSFAIYTALFAGLAGVASTFTQPVATNAGVNIAQLGWLYASFSILSGIITFNSGNIQRIVGIRAWFLTIPFVIGLLFITAIQHPLIAIVALFAVRAAKSVSEPLRSQYINDHAESLGRATIMSTTLMLSTSAVVVFRVIGGVVADYTSPIYMLAIVSGGMMVCSIGLILIESPLPDNMASNVSSGN